MIKRTVIASIASAIAFSAHAAPKWVELPYSTADASFLNHSSIEVRGDFVEVDILRNFDETIILGNDPVSGAEMYAHRSVEVNYRVDCGARKVALTGWRMYDGNFGNGDVVWADINWGDPKFTAAADDESRAVVISACASAMAAEQANNSTL